MKVIKHLPNNSKQNERDKRKETNMTTIHSMSNRLDKPLDIAIRNFSTTLDNEPTNRILTFKSIAEVKTKAVVVARVATCEDL